MVLLPLLIVLVIVGVVYATRSRREHAVAAGDAMGAIHHAEPMSPVGWASLIMLLAAAILWALTNTALPIYYVAALAGVAFLLALVAVTARHDRSPLLLIPLLGVPLGVALLLAFVLLQ